MITLDQEADSVEQIMEIESIVTQAIEDNTEFSVVSIDHIDDE